MTMKWSNAVHNLINVALALLGGLELFDWNIFFDIETSVKLAGALGLTKIIINATRDGLTGLWGEQPPVQK